MGAFHDKCARFQIWNLSESAASQRYYQGLTNQLEINFVGVPSGLSPLYFCFRDRFVQNLGDTFEMMIEYCKTAAFLIEWCDATENMFMVIMFADVSF